MQTGEMMLTEIVLCVGMNLVGAGYSLDDQAVSTKQIDDDGQVDQQIDNTVRVDSMQYGSCFAGTVIEDEHAWGFADSSNLPRDIDFEHELKAGSIHLVALPELVTERADEQFGMALRLINTSGHVVPFQAADGRLSLVQEAIDEDGKWTPVEWLPSSGCGNSYHRVMLDANQYWQFAVPRYKGDLITKVRFRLLIQGHGGLISNEFEGGVNRDQFFPMMNPFMNDPIRMISATDLLKLYEQD